MNGGQTARRYTSKIIKAGALLADTKIVLAQWDLTLTHRGNLSRAKQLNLLGKASRARAEDVLAIFRQRYLTDCETIDALSSLARSAVPASVLNPILYFYAAQADALLHDTAVDLLAPRYWRGERDIGVTDVERFFGELTGDAGPGTWSEVTQRRAARELLAALRDFGVLSGAVKKRLQAYELPVPAFAFLAFVLYSRLGSVERLVNSPEWGLFFLQPDHIERLLIEAQQEHLLSYQSAGRVRRLDFAAPSLEAYAALIAERSH